MISVLPCCVAANPIPASCQASPSVSTSTPSKSKITDFRWNSMVRRNPARMWSPWSWNLTNVDADAFPSAMNDPRWTTPMDFAGFVGGKSAKECTIINNTIWSQKGTSKDHLITEFIRRNFVATKFCGTNLEPNLLQRRWCTDQVGFEHRVESSCHFSVVANERMLSPTTLYELLIKQANNFKWIDKQQENSIDVKQKTTSLKNQNPLLSNRKPLKRPKAKRVRSFPSIVRSQFRLLVRTWQAWQAKQKHRLCTEGWSSLYWFGSRKVFVAQPFKRFAWIWMREFNKWKNNKNQ